MDVVLEVAVFDSLPESHAKTIMEHVFQGLGEAFWENWAALETAPYGQSKHMITLTLPLRGEALTVEVCIDRAVTEEYTTTLVNSGLRKAAENLGTELGEYLGESLIASVTNLWNSITGAFDSTTDRVADVIISARRRLSF